jgi:hypothetical protein
MRRNDPVGYGYPVPQNLRVDQDSEDPDKLFGVSEDTYITTMARPDPDSERRSKVNFEPVSRGGDFPYDEPGETYGSPNVGYGSTPHSVTHSFEITPNDTEHSMWDELEEIIGYPTLLSKSDSSQGGSSLTGIGGWASNPPKPWDEEEDVNESFDSKVPPTENPTGEEAGHHDQTDDDSEKKLERIWGVGDNPNAHSETVVRQHLPMDVHSAWDQFEDPGENSAWGELVKFMMMKDLTDKQRKEPTAVCIKAGEAEDENDDQ